MASMPDLETSFPVSELGVILADEERAMELAAELEEEAQHLQDEDVRCGLPELLTCQVL